MATEVRTQRRVGLAEIAGLLGMKRALCHYYLDRVRLPAHVDELTGAKYFWESEVAAVVRAIDDYRRRRQPEG